MAPKVAYYVWWKGKHGGSYKEPAANVVEMLRIRQRLERRGFASTVRSAAPNGQQVVRRN